MISQRRIRIAALVIMANAAVALQFLPSAQACVDECEKPKYPCMALNTCLEMSLDQRQAFCELNGFGSCYAKCATDCLASAPKGPCAGLPAIQCNYSSSLPLPCPTCTTTVAITSPPNNPNPTDGAWLTNYSFVSTNTISTSATTTPSGAQSTIQWTVTPSFYGIQNLVPANGVGSSISFLPNVSHPAYGSGGSAARSPALSYTIKARTCSTLDTHTVTQDQRDTIRQEYANPNHAQPVPARTDFLGVAATTHFSTSEISQSAYSFLVGNPGALGESVRTAYNARLRTQLNNPNFPDQGLSMSSGWRNPERNELVGGLVNSIHQYGHAVDVQILSSTVTASGLTTAQLWTLLRDAAATAATTAICENGPTQVACTNAQVSHVHAQIN
jgi:hypothetical protein